MLGRTWWEAHYDNMNKIHDDGDLQAANQHVDWDEPVDEIEVHVFVMPDGFKGEARKFASQEPRGAVVIAHGATLEEVLSKLSRALLPTAEKQQQGQTHKE